MTWEGRARGGCWNPLSRTRPGSCLHAGNTAPPPPRKKKRRRSCATAWISCVFSATAGWTRLCPKTKKNGCTGLSRPVSAWPAMRRTSRLTQNCLMSTLWQSYALSATPIFIQKKARRRILPGPAWAAIPRITRTKPRQEVHKS